MFQQYSLEETWIKKNSFCTGNSLDYLPLWLYCISFLHEFEFCGIKWPINSYIFLHMAPVSEAYGFPIQWTKEARGQSESGKRTRGALLCWSWSMHPKIPEWETMFKRKVLTRASIWYMFQQYSLEETWIKRVFLFALEIVRLIATLAILYFFLAWIRILWHQMANKSGNNDMGK